MDQVMVAQGAWQIALDLGARRAECVLSDQLSGRTATASVPTRRQACGATLVDAVGAAAEHLGCSAVDVLGATARCVCTATSATEAMLARDRARTAYLTSDGAEHVPDLLPIAPELVLRVAERTDFRGRTVVALTAAAIDDAAARLRALEVDAVAICLPWSFLAPANERRLAAALRPALPNVYVLASVDLGLVLGEHERGATVALNAVLGPQLAAHLDDLEHALHGAGLRTPLLLRTAAGATVAAGAVRRQPLILLESEATPEWGIEGTAGVPATVGR